MSTRSAKNAINSASTALSWTGGWEYVLGYSQVIVSVRCVDGVPTSGIYFSQTGVDADQELFVQHVGAANVTESYSVPITLPFFKVQVTVSRPGEVVCDLDVTSVIHKYPVAQTRVPASAVVKGFGIQPVSVVGALTATVDAVSFDQGGVGNTVKIDGTTNTVKLDGTTNTIKIDSSTNTVKLDGTTNTIKIDGTTNTVKLDSSTNTVKIDGSTNTVQLASTTDIYTSGDYYDWATFNDDLAGLTPAKKRPRLSQLQTLAIHEEPIQTTALAVFTAGTNVIDNGSGSYTINTGAISSSQINVIHARYFSVLCEGIALTSGLGGTVRIQIKSDQSSVWVDTDKILNINEVNPTASIIGVQTCSKYIRLITSIGFNATVRFTICSS